VSEKIPRDEMLALAEKIEAGEHTIDVQGHPLLLRVIGLRSSCGNIEDGRGISFEFDGEGCWVIPREDLRRLVAAADALDAMEDS
jgi:hypothetical protein